MINKKEKIMIENIYDFVGNKVPNNMVATEERLEVLNEATIRDAESWD